MTEQSTHAPGVPLTPSADERIYTGLRTRLSTTFSDETEEHYTAPPVIARSVSERAGYVRSFPQLLGAVHGAPDGKSPIPTDLVLTSAACHHLYPLLTSGGTGGCLSVEAMCYRGEATMETGRLRSFRMYEVVRYGADATVEKWRGQALATAEQLLGDMGLDVEPCAATDPFFGRTGKYLASAQQADQLKWELVAEVGDGIIQAVASVNYHKDHFGEAFGLTLHDGTLMHSGCVAFGLDRILLALRHRHGRCTGGWPLSLRTAIGM
jgi:seryl-tRNA synthetase